MNVRLERTGSHVAVVTLNDPERRNAMTEQMGDALRETATRIADDPSVRAVVVTGEPPAFSAGGDLQMLENLDERAREEGYDATDFMHRFYDRFLSLGRLPVPVVAAINGHAIGAGLCLALSCDLRVVADEAKVGLNFARLGLHPGMGGSWFLPRVLGSQRAAEWLYTGAIVRGSEAAAQGLAIEAVPACDVLPRALQLAERIAGAAPEVVRQLKVTLAPDQADLDAALDREASCQAANYGSQDLREGLLAARERRQPGFGGR